MESNEIDNKELKESIGNAALSMLNQGADYDELSGLTVSFGYLFDVDGRGIEALLKVSTDIGTFYFAVQKSSLMRININEEMFLTTTESFLGMHG